MLLVVFRWWGFVEDPDAIDDEDEDGDPGPDSVDPDAVSVLEEDPAGAFSCSLLAPVVLLEIIATSDESKDNNKQQEE